MSYPRGMMNRRVTVFAPVRTASEFGQAGIRYEAVKKIWAWVTWVRGARALHHGQMDVYQTVMVRSDPHDCLDRHCRLQIGGKFYAVDSFNESRERHECQLTAFEIDNVNQQD